MKSNQVYVPCRMCGQLITFLVSLENEEFKQFSMLEGIPARVAIKLDGKSKECECGHNVEVNVSMKNINIEIT